MEAVLKKGKGLRTFECFGQIFSWHCRLLQGWTYSTDLSFLCSMWLITKNTLEDPGVYPTLFSISCMLDIREREIILETDWID